jgi:hypothetical protein
MPDRHDPEHGLAITTAARAWSRHLKRLCPPAEGGVVGNRQGEPEKIEDRSDQSFSLAQSEPEHGLQRQRCQDRQRRRPRLAAACRPRCRSPSHDRFLSESDHQAPTLPQARVVVRPVRHLALLLWDMVAAVGVGLERHRILRISREPSSYPDTPLISRPINATSPSIGLRQDRIIVQNADAGRQHIGQPSALLMRHHPILIGKQGSDYLNFEGSEHATLRTRTGSGKTSSVVIPNRGSSASTAASESRPYRLGAAPSSP